MWLINAQTLELEQHAPPSRDSDLKKVVGDAYGETDTNTPYSILSHRWQDGEVSFKDFSNHALRSSKPGFSKITKCCEQSLRDGINHVWVDTCCINKDSDAELSESINSMFTWYREAKVCYVYLHDHEIGTLDTFSDGMRTRSEWFTRGWTLQELIAPRRCLFFDRHWHHIGDRESMSEEIAVASGIRLRSGSLRFLQGLHSQVSYKISIAERMSWASGRQTTRPEDRAYSLIGIFGVNMPMLYGEGGVRAFQRLQEEIIKNSDDYSIFAWPSSLEPGNYGMLALTPNAFRTSGAFRSVLARRGRKPYSMTNRGLTITLPLAPWCIDTYLVLLKCVDDDVYDPDKGWMTTGIFLRRVVEEDSFLRVSVDEHDLLRDLKLFPKIHSLPSFKEVSVNIKQLTSSHMHYELWSTVQGTHVYGFQVSRTLLRSSGSRSVPVSLRLPPRVTFDHANGLVRKEHGAAEYELFATIDLQQQYRSIKLIRLFLDFDFNPIVMMAEASATDALQYPDSRSLADVSVTEPFTVGEEARASLRSFDSRQVDDQYGWNTVRQYKGYDIAMPSLLRPGLWMLKGHRIDGLKVVPLFANLGVDYADLTLSKICVLPRINVRRARLRDGPQVWFVHLDRLPE